MIVLVAGVKGGTGKSTLALNLAVERSLAGHDTLLVDADPDQASLTDWAAVRDEQRIEPRITAVQKSGRRIASDLSSLAERYDDVIVDCGGFDSEELRSALLAAHHWLIPMIPSQFELWTIERLDQLLAGANGFRGEHSLTGTVVATRASTNRQHDDRAHLAAALAEFSGFEVARAVIHERIAFRHAVAAGKGVSEDGIGDSKASQEIKALYQEVFHVQADTTIATASSAA